MLLSANIVKGECNGKKKTKFFDLPLPSASYIRETKIAKGECNGKKKTKFFDLPVSNRLLYW